MALTDQQLEQLYASVYARRLVCPGCGGALSLDPARVTDAVGWVSCDTCGERHFVSQGNDPLRHTFRDYTPEESRVIFATDRKRLAPPTCPVDGTEMDVHLQRSLGLTSNATIRCRRCGRKAEYVRLYG